MSQAEPRACDEPLPGMMSPHEAKSAIAISNLLRQMAEHPYWAKLCAEMRRRRRGLRKARFSGDEAGWEARQCEIEAMGIPERIIEEMEDLAEYAQQFLESEAAPLPNGLEWLYAPNSMFTPKPFLNRQEAQRASNVAEEAREFVEVPGWKWLSRALVHRTRAHLDIPDGRHPGEVKQHLKAAQACAAPIRLIQKDIDGGTDAAVFLAGGEKEQET